MLDGCEGTQNIAESFKEKFSSVKASYCGADDDETLNRPGDCNVPFTHAKSQTM